MLAQYPGYYGVDSRILPVKNARPRQVHLPSACDEVLVAIGGGDPKGIDESNGGGGRGPGSVNYHALHSTTPPPPSEPGLANPGAPSGLSLTLWGLPARLMCRGWPSATLRKRRPGFLGKSSPAPLYKYVLGRVPYYGSTLQRYLGPGSPAHIFSLWVLWELHIHVGAPTSQLSFSLSVCPPPPVPCPHHPPPGLFRGCVIILGPRYFERYLISMRYAPQFS